MPINARLKEDRDHKLFEAMNEENSSRVINALEDGKSYFGFLYSGYFRPSRMENYDTEFVFNEGRTSAIFSRDELEDIPLNIHFVDRRKKENDSD